VRADRLLSMLLLLQARGRMSAGELARRLEVSRRTIYRDLEALSAAGVPVISDMGPHGGASLLPGWRTDLTGLTESELGALLAFASSGPAADLGLAGDLDRAAHKLAGAADPARGPSRFEERVLVDANPWRSPRQVPVHLARVQDALWTDRRIRLRYRRGDGQVAEPTVEPYGLIAKQGTWYLLAGGWRGVRTYRVSRIADATVLDETFERPHGFDLARAWAEHTATWADGGEGLGSRSGPVAVTVRAQPGRSPHFHRVAGQHIRSWGDDDLVVLDFPAEEAAAAFLASFGDSIEVVDPPGVRRLLAEIGRRLVERYR